MDHILDHFYASSEPIPESGIEGIYLYSFTRQNMLRLEDNLEMDTPNNCPSQFAVNQGYFWEAYVDILNTQTDTYANDPQNYQEMSYLEIALEAIKQANKMTENENRLSDGMPLV